MKDEMKAILLSNGILSIGNVQRPTVAARGHLVIEMLASAINSGDKFFLTRPTPPGMPKSLYEIRGVSGVGRVLQTGEGVPERYKGKTVAMYRALSYSEEIVGTWSEYAHLPYLACMILPEAVQPEDYAGSVVNTITPFGFFKQVSAEGHKGIISTAGNSATGIAMLGFSLAYHFPLVSIVRNEEGKEELEALGAKNVVVQSSVRFNQELTEMAGATKATAIFDGVGGQALNKIIDSLVYGSVIYSYGYIGDTVPLTIAMSTLSLKNLTVKPFMNTATDTVRQPEKLEQALTDIGGLIHKAHFRTKPGPRFTLEEINEAIAYRGLHGEKPLLVMR